MLSKPLIAGLLASGCLTAAAGGAYMAVRQNTAETTAAATLDAAAPAPAEATIPGEAPVAESEAVIEPEAETAPTAPPATRTPERPEPPVRRPANRQPAPATRSARANSPAPAPARPAPAREPVEPVSPEPVASRPAPLPPIASPPVEPTPELARLPQVPAAPELIEVVVPSSAVIGLQVDRQISSETARLEDPVEARVTRDVMAGGQLAIPSGSRVLGSVTLVDRGGKVKERAQLGIRFHTLVLADGTRLPLRTETITREGDPVSSESARKIGGAAVGGAILGAILGGGKGAIVGGATGAAGGTAAVMAGGRNPAIIPAGAIVTAQLSSPVNVQVEKEQ